MQALPEPLAPLAAYDQFVVQKLTPKGDKIEKIPVDPNAPLYRIDAMEKSNQLSATEALQYANLLGKQFTVGFVLTENDPFFFVDVDGALQADNTWNGIASEMATTFSGAAVEISASGTGLHIIGSGTAPEHGKRNGPLGIEFYTEKRIINLTGINIIGNAAVDFTPQLAEITNRYFAPREVFNDDNWTTTHCDESTPIEDDDALIQKAIQSGGAGTVFGGKASFKDLWGNNEQVLSVNYPSSTDAYDRSLADQALTQHLLFWTGNNCERTHTLMWKSGLVRDKWDYHESYLKGTILLGKQLQTTFYNKKRAQEDLPPMGENVTTEAGDVLTSGLQLMTVKQQLEHFRDCFYIVEMDRVFTPKGLLLKSGQFKALYGGYQFTLDSIGMKETKNAWEVFTESQAVRFPKVDNLLFKPDRAPNEIIQREGREFVNSFKPIHVERTPGDITPFLNHVQKIIPNATDRKILLSYMAACVQYAGVKFQWAPLLQGVEGNGKSFFSLCVANAVGLRYSHFPKAADLANKFNSWMLNKIFIGVEDIYVAESKQEVIEALKPMITQTQIEIELKSVDKVTCDVCCNFILNSNHRDGIRKTKNDRRFCIFYTAQQEEDHLKRDGLTGDYFPKLYEWLNNGGYAIVTDYLHNYTIEDQYNPATACHRAPTTSTTEEAIKAGLGGVESEIMEAIEEGRTGFAGGWVSSVALDALLKDLRANRAIPQNKRPDIMRALGYVFHPALDKGRLKETTPHDRTKPKLYVNAENTLLMGLSKEDVASTYIAAQNSTNLFAQNPAERVNQK